MYMYNQHVRSGQRLIEQRAAQEQIDQYGQIKEPSLTNGEAIDPQHTEQKLLFFSNLQACSQLVYGMYPSLLVVWKESQNNFSNMHTCSKTIKFQGAKTMWQTMFGQKGSIIVFF